MERLERMERMERMGRAAVGEKAERGQAARAKVRKAFRGNQKAHFNLGTEKMAYESSTQSGYDNHKDPVNPYKAFDKRSDRVAEAAQAALSKVSNVSIGRKGAGTDADHFRSTMEMHYVDKGADGLTTLDKGALDDLRATHYSLGNETCDYVTTNDLGVQVSSAGRTRRTRGRGGGRTIMCLLCCCGCAQWCGVACVV